MGFETDVIWNPPFADLNRDLVFLKIKSWRKKTSNIWLNIIFSAKNGHEVQNQIEMIKKSSKMAPPLLNLFIFIQHII